MLPEHVWWQGNPHYNSLWATRTAQERLQRQVLEALLQALPEDVGRALVAELMAARHPGQVQALRVAELTQGAIDAVLRAATAQAVTYRLQGEDVAMVPLHQLQRWATADLQKPGGHPGSFT